jgi:secernin
MCDTWIALPTATRTQHVILGKNSDRPLFDCQPLLYYPRQSWPAGSQIQLEYMALPQVESTWATLGSSPYWCWGYEEGINERGVVIGNEAIYTRELREAVEAYRSGHGPALGLLGMDLVRLGLERSATAHQAVTVMGELIEGYGQFGSGVPGQDHAEGSYDNSFIIADSAEAWVLEAVGRRWVARKVTEDTWSISNEPTIRQHWDTGSPDIETYALQESWWRGDWGTPFDFARAYVDARRPRQVAHLRAMRSRQLLTERAGDITPQWMMRIARDHYEDTFLDGPYFDAADPDFHTICMHVSPAGFTWGNTASSCVAVLPKSEAEVPVFWWTPGPPCNGCYVPFFVHGSHLPEIVSSAGTFGKRVVPPPEAIADEFASTSYWWLFRRLIDVVKGDPIQSVPGCYPARNRQVRAQFDALEQDFVAQLPEVMRTATASGQVDTQVLNTFTAACVERVLKALHGLLNTFEQETHRPESATTT